MRYEKRITTDLKPVYFQSAANLYDLTPLSALSSVNLLPFFKDVNELFGTSTSILSDIELTEQLFAETSNVSIVKLPTISAYPSVYGAEPVTFRTYSNKPVIGFYVSTGNQGNYNGRLMMQVTDMRALTSDFNIYAYTLDINDGRTIPFESYVYEPWENPTPSALGTINNTLTSNQLKQITCIPTLSSSYEGRIKQNLTCSVVQVSSDIIPLTELVLQDDPYEFFPTWISNTSVTLPQQKYYFTFPVLSPDSLDTYGTFFWLNSSEGYPAWNYDPADVPTGLGYVTFTLTAAPVQLKRKTWTSALDPTEYNMWVLGLSSNISVFTNDNKIVYYNQYNPTSWFNMALDPDLFSYLHQDTRAIFNPSDKVNTLTNSTFSATSALWSTDWHKKTSRLLYLSASLMDVYWDGTPVLSSFVSAVTAFASLYNNISSVHLKKSAYNSSSKISNIDNYNGLYDINLPSGTTAISIAYQPPLTSGYFNFFSISANATYLDISKNTSLKTLDCSYNLLTSLDLSGTNVMTVNCSNNRIEQLTLPSRHNCSLSNLDASYNNLSSVYSLNLPIISNLDLSYNQLTSFVVSSYNVNQLNVSFNNIQSFEEFIAALSATIFKQNIKLSIANNPGYNAETGYKLDPFTVQPLIITPSSYYTPGIHSFVRGSNQSYACGNNYHAIALSLVDTKKNLQYFTGANNYTLALSSNGILFGTGSGNSYQLGANSASVKSVFELLSSNMSFNKIVATNKKSLLLSGTDLYVMGNSNKLLSQYATLSCIAVSARDMFISNSLAGYIDTSGKLHISTGNTGYRYAEYDLSVFNFGLSMNEYYYKLGRVFLTVNSVDGVVCAAADVLSLMIQTADGLKIFGTSRYSDADNTSTKFYKSLSAIPTAKTINNTTINNPVFSKIVAGDRHYLALSGNAVFGFGGNDKGQLGTPPTYDFAATTPCMHQLCINSATPLYAQKICAGDTFSAVLNDNKVYVSGDNSSYQLKDTPGNLSNFTEINGNWSDVFCTSNTMFLVSAV